MGMALPHLKFSALTMIGARYDSAMLSTLSWAGKATDERSQGRMWAALPGNWGPKLGPGSLFEKISSEERHEQAWQGTNLILGGHEDGQFNKQLSAPYSPYLLRCLFCLPCLSSRLFLLSSRRDSHSL